MRFLGPDGLEISVPREWEPAIIDLDVHPEGWESVRLSVNGNDMPVRVERIAGQASVLADWTRSGPGSYRVVVNKAGERQEVTVTISSAKLGDAGLSALTEELTFRLPTSVAVGLQRGGGLVGINLQPPGKTTLAQELLRLRRAVDGPSGGPGLAHILPAIAIDPHRNLVTVTRWVPRERARRVPVAGITRTLTRPGNLDDQGGPQRAIDERTEHTFDVLENRLLKLFVTEVLIRIRRLQTVASEGGAQDLERLETALVAAVARAPFLGEVELARQPPNRETMMMTREPRYRAMLDRYLEYHRSVWATVAEPALDAPLEQVPLLYELWGTLLVVDAVVAEAVEAGHRVVHQRVVRRAPGALFVEVVPSGRSLVELQHRETGERIVVTAQRSFGASGEYRSVSLSQRPDVTVEIRRQSGASEFVVFDPKYKLVADDEGSGTPVKADVDKMHAYRDAIRGPGDSHVVRFAATLYPGQSIWYGQDLAALGAQPDRPSGFIEEARSVLRRILQGPGHDQVALLRSHR